MRSHHGRTLPDAAIIAMLPHSSALPVLPAPVQAGLGGGAHWRSALIRPWKAPSPEVAMTLLLVSPGSIERASRRWWPDRPPSGRHPPSGS
ncbi:hypothetical protein LAD77_29780 [Klebsiella pneumoniae]|nr:hypothetical protein [Klebsiella pneumoniae]